MLGIVDPLVPGRPLPRRAVLRNAGRGALGLAVLALTTTACGSEPPPDVDDLRAQLAAANSDSDLAQALAAEAAPAQVPTLTQIAGERTRHARALADEISRTLGTVVDPTPSTTAGPQPSAVPDTATPDPAVPDPATPPPRPPSVADLSEALRAAADSAAGYAARESGYRAGLLGSIAASCTAAYTVALPSSRAAQ